MGYRFATLPLFDLNVVHAFMVHANHILDFKFKVVGGNVGKSWDIT
jgi:hypothetical protein